MRADPSIQCSAPVHTKSCTIPLPADDWGKVNCHGYDERPLHLHYGLGRRSQDAGAGAFVQRAAASRFSAVWIRIGRGTKADKNLGTADLRDLKAAFRAFGVELWGWHVPFCKDEAAVKQEIAKLKEWVDLAELDGIVVDAERTRETPRFQGGEDEARTYSKLLAEFADSKEIGLGFSSHDQPSLHRDLPFSAFLTFIADVCPQVYYQSANVEARLNKSVHDYRPLLGQDFAKRFKPTGNITVDDDLPLPNAATCVAAAGNFIAMAKQLNCTSYSFWCWDSAPEEIWEFFASTPV